MQNFLFHFYRGNCYIFNLRVGKITDRGISNVYKLIVSYLIDMLKGKQCHEVPQQTSDRSESGPVKQE